MRNFCAKCTQNGELDNLTIQGVEAIFETVIK